MVEIRPARAEELEVIWALVCAARRRMNEQGNPQWGEDYPTRALYLADIARGELYAAEEAGRILGVSCITTEQGPEYEAVAWAVPAPALVIHRMAVDPPAQGRGVARALFAFAEALAVRRGIGAMHMDTYAQNTRMQALMRSRGFVPRGEIRLHGRPLPFPCFEKLLNRPEAEA